MPRLALYPETVALAETAQSAMDAGGRILLTVATALFASYLLFLVGALLASRLAGLVRDARRSGDAQVPGAPAPRVRVPAWHGDQATGPYGAELHGVRA